MPKITLNSPMLSATDGGAVTNVYSAVISTMADNANRILSVLDNSDGDREVLLSVINALHSLTANCFQYSLHACVAYAMKRSQTDLVDAVFRHPLLKIIYMYLACGGYNSGTYIDWTVRVTVTPVGFFGYKKLVEYRIEHSFASTNPAENEPGSVKINVVDMGKKKSRKPKRQVEEGEEFEE